jgi:hypothetical protein
VGNFHLLSFELSDLVFSNRASLRFLSTNKITVIASSFLCVIIYLFFSAVLISSVLFKFD